MPASMFRKMVGQFNHFRIFGEPVCPHCGSNRVTTRGFSGSNRRHDCVDCGSSMRVDY